MRGALPWLLATLGGALVVVGLAVALTSGATPGTVYTGSYSPFEAEDLGAYQSRLTLTFDGTVHWTPGQLVGGGLLVLGLLVLTALAGWLVGLRSARRRTG
jgi:hypothetical protein